MKQLKPCGTEAAYKRHQRNGEKTCAACKQAQARVSRRKRSGLKAVQKSKPLFDWDRAVALRKADEAVRYADEGECA